ncbi:hypothetical protein [Fusobacterium varium]|uniref:hypothetical protein n=1 Tax=Fusobacterium varium TaxID=856 RepID=UPI0022E3CE22|nr:hypothetical protein [Fusobacterium varium]
MYWVSYYLEKGFKLDYLLSLSETEKLFFIFSMHRARKEQAEYDAEKIKAFTGGA